MTNEQMMAAANAYAEAMEKKDARIEELEAALKFYADEDNWMRNGPLDASSANFTGGPADDVLGEKNDG